MSWYGNIDNMYLTRDVIRCILNHLPQCQWSKLELNHKLINVIGQCRRPIIELCRRGDLESVDPSIVSGISLLHRDVAVTCHYLLDSHVICLGPGAAEYYHYSDHRWALKSNSVLGSWIRNELTDLYQAVLDGIRITNNKLYFMVGIKSFLRALGRVVFVKSITSELLELYYTVGVTMNVNKNLWGCSNGVMVVEDNQVKFRDGLPTDYITLSTNLVYDDELTFSSFLVKKLEHILHQIFPIVELYDYIMKLFSSFLSDHDHYFILLDNSECSGRSTIIELIRLAFGEYCSQTEGARILLVDDNNYDVGLRNLCHAIQKEYRKPNVDTIEARADFEVIPFLSRFGARPNSLPSDPNLNDELKGLAPAFLWLLVQHYTLLKRNGLQKPQCVVDETLKYWEF